MKSVTYKANPLISIDDLALLKSQVKNSNEVARYCYHESEASELHVMLICMPVNKEYPIHRHSDSDENIVLIGGDLYITMYNDSGEIIDTVHLKAVADKDTKNIAMIIKKNQWHSVKSGQSGASFMEIKTGPFDRGLMEFFADDNSRSGH